LVVRRSVFHNLKKVSTEYSFSNARMKHYDITRSLISMRPTISSTIIGEKVLAHTGGKKLNRPYTRAEILNQACDRLAKKASVECEPCGPLSFQHEGLSLWQGTTKINHDVKAHIEQIFYEKKAAATICVKYEWSLAQFEMVDWKSNDRAMKMMTVPTRSWISKYVTHFLPIGRNMQRMGKWTMSHCPRCCVAEESHEHLMQCMHAPSRDLLMTNIAKLRDWLQHMSTPSALELQIISSIHSYFRLFPISVLSPHPLLQKQLQLGGWEHFMQGRIHRDFSSYMQRDYDELDEKKSGTMWVAGFIQRIWTLLYRPIWDLRNEYVHEKVNEVNMTRTREDLQQRVREKYVNNDITSFLSQDQHLLANTLEDTLGMSDMALRAWLLTFKIADDARQRAYEVSQNNSRATLRPWLVPISLSTSIAPSSNVKTPLRKKRRTRVKRRRRIRSTCRRLMNSTCGRRTLKQALKRSGFYRPP